MLSSAGGRIAQIKQNYQSDYADIGLKQKRIGADQDAFQRVMAQKLEEGKELKFSRHAAERLSDRDISLSQDQSERLKEGVNKAWGKGIRDSLVVMDGLTFIVNVPNRVVVTAMDQDEVRDNVYTNIDGAVFV